MSWVRNVVCGALEEIMKMNNQDSLCPRFTRSLVLVLGTVLLCGVMAAQGRSGGSPTRGTANNSRPNTTITPTDLSKQPTFISGSVLLEGGAPVTEPVAIERLCNGSVRREGYTDFKGHFQIQLGSNFGFQDASENDPRAISGQPLRTSGQSGSSNRSSLNGCEFRAVLAGYQSSTVMLRVAGDSFASELGTIVLKRLGDVQGTTVSLTSMTAPRDAKQAFEKGRKALSQDKTDEAVKDLEKATEKYPQFAAAWTMLGDIHLEHDLLDKATEEYKRALAADPQYVNPLFGLALIAAKEKKWQEVANYSSQVMSLNAYAFPSAYFFNAAANYNVGRFAVAEESARKYKASADHKHPEVSLLLGSILARKEDYSGAAQQLRDYLASVPDASNANELQTKIKQYDQLSMAKK